MAKQNFGSKVNDAFAFGIGAGFGYQLISIFFAIIGFILFIPGLFMVKEERKKPDDKQNKAKLYGGFVLMALGSIFGFAIGGVLLSGFALEEFLFDM